MPVDALNHALARWTAIFHDDVYLGYILEKHTGAIYVPRIWVEPPRHAERRLALRLWKLNRRLTTGPQL